MLKINNIEYINIIDFNLSRSVGNHTSVFFKALIKDNYFDEYAELVDNDIEIKYYDDIIFKGYITTLVMENINNNSFVNLYASSYSKKEDIVKHTRIFQNENKTYKNIVDSLSLKNTKPIILNASIENEKIEKPVIQFNETDFTFLKRFFNRKKQPIVNDDLSDSSSCRMFIGKRENITWDIKKYSNYSLKTSADSSSQIYVFNYKTSFAIGDFITTKNRKSWIVRVDIFFKNNILHSEVETVDISKFPIDDFDCNLFPRSFSGRIIDNKDKKNSGKVQVGFINIEDKCLDNKYWFPVNSPYTTKDVGFFFIPAIGDEVVVTFLDYDISYISSSMRKNKNELFSNPQHLYIRNEFKKEINLKEKEMNLISSENTYIKLTEEFIELKNENSTIRLNKESIILKVGNSTININELINLKAANNGRIEIGDNIANQANNITFKANGDTKIDANKIGLKSSGNIDLKGSSIKLN